MKNNEIQQILAIHQWEHENLPLFKKSIGQAVVLRLIEAFILDETLSVKELTLCLPYSSSGIRLQLRMLEKQGWIEPSVSNEDQRVKIIRPGARFKDLMKKYREMAQP